MSTAPWLILAVGNPARGDDALGPMLVERLRAAGVEGAGDVELLVDMQLQIEHATDLAGRRGVLFVDAARPGLAPGPALAPIAPARTAPTFTHALGAGALLEVADRVCGGAPPAWQLAIAGESFVLGEGRCAPAQRRLDDAERIARQWLRSRRAVTGGQPPTAFSAAAPVRPASAAPPRGRRRRASPAAGRRRRTAACAAVRRSTPDRSPRA